MLWHIHIYVTCTWYILVHARAPTSLAVQNWWWSLWQKFDQPKVFRQHSPILLGWPLDLLGCPPWLRWSILPMNAWKKRWNRCLHPPAVATATTGASMCLGELTVGPQPMQPLVALWVTTYSKVMAIHLVESWINDPNVYHHQNSKLAHGSSIGDQ